MAFARSTSPSSPDSRLFDTQIIAPSTTEPTITIASAQRRVVDVGDHERRDQQRDQVHHLDQRVERRTGRVLERVADRVADDRGLVALRTLAAVVRPPR